MTVVVDTNVLFEILFNGKNKEYYFDLINNADEVLAPEFLIAESTNVMRQYIKAGFADENNAKLSLAYGLQLIRKYEKSTDYTFEVLHESVRLNHPSYDIFYFVLARHNAATLLTVDQKLATLCRENGVDVA